MGQRHATQARRSCWQLLPQRRFSCGYLRGPLRHRAVVPELSVLEKECSSESLVLGVSEAEPAQQRAPSRSPGLRGQARAFRGPLSWRSLMCRAGPSTSGLFAGGWGHGSTQRWPLSSASRHSPSAKPWVPRGLGVLCPPAQEVSFRSQVSGARCPHEASASSPNSCEVGPFQGLRLMPRCPLFRGK